MVKKLLLQRTIKRTADGDFSKFMTQGAHKDVLRVLEYAAQRANEDQKRLVKTTKY